MIKTSINARKFIGYSPFPYLTGRRLILLVGMYLLIALMVLGIVKAAHWVIIEEVRVRARELASLVALHVDAKAHETVHTVEDMSRPEYQGLVKYFQGIVNTHPDIRYVYTMRPIGNREWEYVIDAQPEDIDLNNDNIIQPIEEGVKPGRPMTRLSPAKEAALVAPTAEPGFYHDQWGTFISAYAPIIDSDAGKTIGVLGVDVPKEAIGEKGMLVNIAGAIALVVLMSLGTMSLGALFQKAEALRTISRLDEEIHARNRQLARSLEALTDRERMMQHDLMVAQELQQRYLPEEFPQTKRTNCAAAYRAASIIGGDLYDVFPLSERVMGFFIADVSGHGVSAALITTLLKVSADRFRRLLDEAVDSTGVDTEEVNKALELFMSKLNDAIAEATQTGRFVTFSLCLLDLETGDVLVASAGHQPPLIWKHATRAVAEAQVPANLPLGLVPQQDFEITRMKIDRGDKLIVYTDGITERRNRDGVEFGVLRFIDLINKKGREEPDTLVKEIVEENERFAGDVQADDDRALLVVEYL